VEIEEASLPTLKAAAGNPEGSFTPAAAEAGLEVGGDAPVMTEAVGPLVTTVVGKTRPPAWTSLQLAGSTVRSQAASNLGIDSYTLAKGGWKITRENIEKLIPDLKELMSSLPAGTPIIIFCLDNSCFLAATEEGGLAPISKCVPEDDGYHVNGALVVAPECALQLTLDLLKRLVTELSEYQIFIVTPITRYIRGPCCDAAGHVSNSGDPDFLSTILSGLTKLKFLLRKKLAPATVLDGIELISGSGCGREWTEQILRTSWADPVHPKQHIYSKIALNLIEKVAASNSTPTSQKRARSESSEDTSSSRGRQDRSVRGSGSRGGQQANPSNSSNTAYTAPGSSRSAGASRTATITHGRLQGEEVSFLAFPAEGMQEGEAMAESEAAATTTGEASLAEAGGGPGAAGRSRSPGSI
jgi:hypothetical protein